MERPVPRNVQVPIELRPQLSPSLAAKVLCHSTGFILSECVSECVAPVLLVELYKFFIIVNLACIILATSLLCVLFCKLL